MVPATDVHRKVLIAIRPVHKLLIWRWYIRIGISSFIRCKGRWNHWILTISRVHTFGLASLKRFSTSWVKCPQGIERVALLFEGLFLQIILRWSSHLKTSLCKTCWRCISFQKFKRGFVSVVVAFRFTWIAQFIAWASASHFKTVVGFCSSAQKSFRRRWLHTSNRLIVVPHTEKEEVSTYLC